MGLFALLAALAGCTHAPVRAPMAGAPDVILVLGHKPPLHAGVLERELRARVDHGVALYREGRAPLLMMSGGESTVGTVEADVMAAYAGQAGVPAAALLRERASRDTIENARFSVALLRARLQRDPRVLLVTSDYHSERAARLLRCAGAQVAEAPASPPFSARERARRLRSERWIRFYYRFFDACARADSR
jgi:uncharacterized SAM-binding protein YcdF (DUF218 family)